MALEKLQYHISCAGTRSRNVNQWTPSCEPVVMLAHYHCEKIAQIVVDLFDTTDQPRGLQ